MSFDQVFLQEFLADIINNDWENNITDTNAKYRIFIWDLEHYVNKHAPLKKMNKREQKIKTKPWITDQILKKIKNRNNLFAERKETQNGSHLKSVYNKLRNFINKETILAKKEYFRNYFEN